MELLEHPPPILRLRSPPAYNAILLQGELVIGERAVVSLAKWPLVAGLDKCKKELPDLTRQKEPRLKIDTCFFIGRHEVSGKNSGWSMVFSHTNQGSNLFWLHSYDVISLSEYLHHFSKEYRQLWKHIGRTLPR